MSVRNYQHSLRNNREEAGSFLLFVIDFTVCVLSRSRNNLLAEIHSIMQERTKHGIVQKSAKFLL